MRGKEGKKKNYVLRFASPRDRERDRESIIWLRLDEDPERRTKALLTCDL